MTLSRRGFLGNIGKLAAVHVVPTPISRLTNILSETAGPASQVMASASSLLSGTMVESVIGELNDSWENLSNTIDYGMEFSNASLDGIHDTVTGHLHDHFPKFLNAVSQFRDLKKKLLTGDEKQDSATMNVLSGAIEIKKQIHKDDLSHLVSLCPPSSDNSEVLWLNPHYSREELQELYGEETQSLIMKDLAAEAGYIGEDIDDYMECPLAEIKSCADMLLDRAMRAGIVDDNFNIASQMRSDSAHLAIEMLCKPGGITAEMVKSLTSFLPDIDTTKASTLNIEFYELFDDKTLFKFVAQAVGDQSDWMLQGLKSQYGKTISSDSLDYITNNFQPTLQNLYQQYFRAAMPDIIDVPLPVMQNATAEFFSSNGWTKITQAETEIEAEDLSSNAMLEAASTDSVASMPGLSSSLARLAQSSAAKLLSETPPVAPPNASVTDRLRAGIGGAVSPAPPIQSGPDSC